MYRKRTPCHAHDSRFSGYSLLPLRPFLSADYVPLAPRLVLSLIELSRISRMRAQAHHYRLELIITNSSSALFLQKSALIHSQTVFAF